MCLGCSCSCIILHFAPYAMHHIALGSCLFIYVRSRGAEIKKFKRSKSNGHSEDHTHQVVRILTFLLDQGKPNALTNDPYLLLLNLALCSFMIVH
jgi:hypothetical protein